MAALFTKNHLLKSIFLLLLFCFTVNGDVRCENSRNIRVLVMKSEQPLILGITGQYAVKDFLTKKNISISSDLNGVRMLDQAGKLKIAGVSFPDQIEIHSLGTHRIKLNDRFYRGFLNVTRHQDGFLSIVNVVPLDDYLYGVLMKEVGEWWPAEALKAQAVAARTYAMYQMQTQAKQNFDVFNNQFSQMYGGANSENPRGNSAVDETRGQVLTYDNRIFPSFYHATCGGMTRPASDLWDISIPPLNGGVECQSCWFSPHYSWDASFSLSEIKQSLSNFLQDFTGPITNIEVSEVTPYHRVKKLILTDGSAQREVPSKNFRANLGSERVRSETFEIYIKGSEARLKGHGWGHGVGMCQWGALGMSIFRKKYTDILSFYYPDSVLVKKYD